MNPITVPEFASRKAAGVPISMVTCYDFWLARIIARSRVDTVLVGDSLAMVMHGFESTLHATVDLMALHVAAVARGAPAKFIVGDMPFLACRKGLVPAMDAVQQIMTAGANAVKIEGEPGQLDLMAHIVESGVPVMGHLGLTPQSVEAFGGHRVQGRSEGQASAILESARRLEDAGCFSLVLECVPAPLGKLVSENVDIPVIGIGAGPFTDGQVLVLQDLLGADPDFNPRFLRRYADAFGTVTEAVDGYHDDVVSGRFPSPEECYA